MKRFFVQMAALFIFVEILLMLFSPVFAYLDQSGWGYGLRITGFIALGWYWARICNYIEAKVRNLASRKE